MTRGLMGRLCEETITQNNVIEALQEDRIDTVIPHRKIRGCDWSKSRHVTFTKTH